MNRMRISATIATILVGATSLTSAYAQTPTPGFNNKIPPEIMTPDTVETRIGTLKFFDGFPTKETSQKVYDHLDFIRGVEVFLNFIPAASVEAIRRGAERRRPKTSNQVIISDQLPIPTRCFSRQYRHRLRLGDPRSRKDGPTVVEIPPGTGPGTVDDAFFRFVSDMGRPGPTRARAAST